MEMSTMTKFEPKFPSGNRMPAYYELRDYEIQRIIEEAEAIGIASRYLRFNNPNIGSTSYHPRLDIINIKGNIFPDLRSPHPRDMMSIKAVLAHEFYGHRPYRAQYLLEIEQGTSRDTWNDEFRASYMAALNAPGLDDAERRLLMLDAVERAREAHMAIRPNRIMRVMIYGY